MLRFAPTHADSHAFNPLLEVRRGANEVRDVQNIVEILVDPAGDARHQDFWDRSAKHVLVGVILHVLYVEPVERKTLAVVRERLRDLDATAQAMKSVYHRISPTTGAPEVHPEVLHAAESFLAGEERMQSGIKATAESFFGLFADEIVARKTATSDFRIGDLMCGVRPVTLFLQPPPSDALRLVPLMRLLINQIARALMEHQTRDAQGRAKRHRMLLLLDEFPNAWPHALLRGDDGRNGGLWP
ncbi:MAG: type IV secretory system conjugative DNA transfer family protein [Caulobacteraceae bacterium]|nr:type IV secretory system conjugative DNA transfer family protein [Caulobacteraceae bacterium]